MSPAIEKLEKAGKVAAAITAIVGAVVGLTSWTTQKLVVEPLQEEIAEVRKDAQSLSEWKTSQEQQSKVLTDVLRDRLQQHEVAFAELRGTIEALRVELRYARTPRGVDMGGSSTSTALTRPPAPVSIEAVRASSDRALGRSTAALNELRGDPLRGLNEL
jgi:hypothetical protein